MRRATVGIVGAGQLARMTAQAAISLAVDTRVLAKDPSDSACLAASILELGDPDDAEVLTRFARGCDVLTLDHELVQPALLVEIERGGCHVRPGGDVLRFADKAHQRSCLQEMGFPVPPFARAESALDVIAFAAVHGWPVVVKTATGGYDGRGVFVVEDPAAARRVASELASRALVVEPLLEIDCELAVVVARRPSGEVVTYPVVETFQDDGICLETVVPAMLEPALSAMATDLAVRVANAIGATGVLAVELFATPHGLMINELAPRPHNSGHWTIEGAATSQFENHIRAILDWPLGATTLMANSAATVNVLGGVGSVDPVALLPAALAVRGASIHLYGKSARPGRKLGHVTALGSDRGAALTLARTAAAALKGPRSLSTSEEGHGI